MGTSLVRIDLSTLDYWGQADPKDIWWSYFRVYPYSGCPRGNTSTLGCFLCFQVMPSLSSHQCPPSPDTHQDTARLEEQGCPWIRPWLLFHPHLLASLEKFPGEIPGGCSGPVWACWAHWLGDPGAIPAWPRQGAGARMDLSMRRRQFTLIFGGILQDPVKSVCREGNCFVLSSDQCWVSSSLWEFPVLFAVLSLRGESNARGPGVGQHLHCPGSL